MFVDTAKGEGDGRLAEAVDHPIARDMPGVGIHVQGVADHAAPARIAGEHGDLSVGRDLSIRYPPHDVIYQLKAVFHSIIILFIR